MPQYLTTTYDHFGFERHKAVAYNAHVYLTALSAGVKLAEAVADAAAAAEVMKSLALAQKAVVDDTKLWNSTENFFRCHTDTVWQAYTKQANTNGQGNGNGFSHTVGSLAAGGDFKPAANATFLACQTTCAAAEQCLGFTFESNNPVPSGEILCYTKTVIHLQPMEPAPNQIFTDTLYGQMLSHHFLNGTFTIDTAYLSSHLKYEWEKNQDTYGMRVLSNPVQEDSIWMNGPPTWSYLQLALGEVDFETAVEPFKRMSENFRTRLRDMWNLRALTHTDGSIKPAETTRPIEQGAPREQGHYGFMLTDLYLYPLLSGQVVDMAAGTLELAPMFPAPYVMPVLISGVEASLERYAERNHHLFFYIFSSFPFYFLVTPSLSVLLSAWPTPSG